MKTNNFWKNSYLLNIGASYKEFNKELNCYEQNVRVPGGWIYSTFIDSVNRNKVCAFIPFNNEFQIL